MSIVRLRLFALLLPMISVAGGCAVNPSASVQVPGFHYGASGSGCSNFFVYTENSAQTEVLVVEGDSDSLGLTITPKSFLLEQSSGILDLRVDFYTGASDGNRYCSDVGGGQTPSSQWKAVRGRAEMSVSAVDVPFNTPYQITIRLYDVELRSPQGDRSVRLPALTIENVTVGWLPG